VTATDRIRVVSPAEPAPERDWVTIGMAVLTILGALAAGIVAADSALLAVAAAGALVLGVAIILRPDVATLTAIAILYSNAAVVAVKFHGVPLFIGAAVPLLLVVPLARDLVVRRLPVVAPPMLPWMIVLLIIHLVSALFSSDMIRSWDGVVVFAIEGFGLYFLLINVIRTPEMLRQVTWVLLAAGAFVSIFSIHQDFTNNYDSNYWGFAQPADAAFRTGETTLVGDVTQRRLAGSIGETNRFAQVMLMLVPLGIFRFIAEPRQALKVAAAIMTGLVTLGVVLTFSRGAAVGLGALVIALAVLRMVRLRHLALLVLALAVVLAAFPQYALRIGSIAQVGALAGEDVSRSEVSGVILSRATETMAAALVIVDHPVLGVGPDMFNLYYEQYADIVGLLVKEGQTREAHNLYLGVGAELGIFGLAVFLWIGYKTVSMVLEARRRSIRRRPDLEMLTTPFALSLLTYYVTGLFLHLSFARFYWLILALAGAAAIITLREMTAEDAREGPTGNDGAAARPASPGTPGRSPAT
jgi:putative inorganic carbon (HCO3(-)) transporter